jgi:hypothetical protein
MRLTSSRGGGNNAANHVDTDIVDIVDGKALLGFRVPVVIASPFSRGDEHNPRVGSLTFDHTSVLKLIEWRLTPRDGGSDEHNLAYALNLRQPQTVVPSLLGPEAPAIVASCFQSLVGVLRAEEARSEAPSSSAKTAKWNDLRSHAPKYGFKAQIASAVLRLAERDRLQLRKLNDLFSRN